MFIVCLILFIGIIVVIYWNYIRLRQFKTIYKKLLQIAGFKYSHLTNQEREQEIKESREATRSSAKDVRESYREAPHSNPHFIIYGSKGSGKISLLKQYLAQIQRSYVVFGRDEREFPSPNFAPLLQLENVSIAELCKQLAKKTVVLDDAGAYKSLKTKVEDLFRYGRHHQIQVIYLAHYAKDVLPIVRDNCHKIFLTIDQLITQIISSSRLYKLLR